MVAAPEEAHLAVVVAWRHQIDLHQRVLAMGLVDLLVRNLGEIGVAQHADERVDQLAVGPFDGGGIDTGPVVDVRAEVEVVVAQPFEPVEEPLVQDRAEQAAELSELLPLGLVANDVVSDDRVDHVDLADRE